MEQTRFEQERALNRAAYDQLREHLRQNYAGQYVAIAQGRLVGAASTFDDATAAVLSLQPPPEHFLVFEAEEDPMFDILEDFHREFVDDYTIEVVTFSGTWIDGRGVSNILDG